MRRTKNEAILEQLRNIAENPGGFFPAKGAYRRYPLSTYIKKKLRGKINSFLADELHEYNNASGQGDAMAEIFGAAKQFVGMTATLINGYSSGIFHLLYRIVPGLMRKDGKPYRRPSDFDAEYGVVENTYEVTDGDYNSNRRTTKRKTKSKKLPGVSPLVFSRFLLEYTAFLSLSDMGKDLPDYEEIPIPLDMPEEVYRGYKQAEDILQSTLRSDRKAANKLLSAYLNLLTVYPDQPYDQPDIFYPSGEHRVVLVHPENTADFDTILPKEEQTLEIVRRKIAARERVFIYTSWTRADSQQKLMGLLTREGIRTEILTPKISPEKREEWVEKRVKSGVQVLITNPECVKTGLDLNAFTTLIFYSMGYNLFTLRQASRRSWRINQTAPRVEVYMLYYKDTMQAKAMKLMASKLAVAGIIEGTFSEDGLAPAFKKMAIINPARKRTVPVTQASVSEEPPDIAEVLQTAASEAPAAASARSAGSDEKQALYEGLLQKSIEEQKKRKPKKRTEVENQLSLFGFVA